MNSVSVGSLPRNAGEGQGGAVFLADVDPLRVGPIQTNENPPSMLNT
jgi:hypothetical protein